MINSNSLIFWLLRLAYSQPKSEAGHERRPGLEIGSQEINQPVPQPEDTGRPGRPSLRIYRVERVLELGRCPAPVDAHYRRGAEILYAVSVNPSMAQGE